MNIMGESSKGAECWSSLGWVKTGICLLRPNRYKGSGHESHGIRWFQTKGKASEKTWSKNGPCSKSDLQSPLNYHQNSMTFFSKRGKKIKISYRHTRPLAAQNIPSRNSHRYHTSNRGDNMAVDPHMWRKDTISTSLSLHKISSKQTKGLK